MSKVKVVILSVPFTVPVPIAAPALISGCLNAAGITSVGLDFSFSVFEHFHSHPWWVKFKIKLTLTGQIHDPISIAANVLILRHLVQYLKDIKEKYDPEWIGLSLFTHQSHNFSYPMIRMIRKYLPGTKIVLGGKSLELKHDNRFIYERYRDQNLVDLIIVGDAEVSIIDAIRNDSRGVVLTPQQTQAELDNIPPPNWSGYDMSAYQKYNVLNTGIYIPITASKGCVRQCTFCDVASFWPKYIFRDGAKVADDMISTYQSTGATRFMFTDNLINGSISHFRKMNERLVEKIPNTISYNGYAIFRSRTSSPESDFELSAAAGCAKVFLGLEAGSEKVRNDMKKKFTDDDIEYSANQYYKNKIKQAWLFIIGYPTETEDDFKESLRMLKYYSPMAKDGQLIISATHPFMLLGNSPLIQDQAVADHYGFSLDPSFDPSLFQYFWYSSLNKENTFPIRADRWRRFYNAVIENKYQWNGNVDINTLLVELTEHERIYKENVKKYIPILKS